MSDKVRLYANVATTDNRMDIYLPSENAMIAPAPVIFFIHGGGWVLGSKEGSRSTCQNLAQNGYICVSTEYSLSSATDEQIAFGLNLFILAMLSVSLICTTMTQIMLVLIFMFLVVGIFACLSKEERAQHPAHIMDVAKTFDWTTKNIAQYNGNPEEIFIMGHSAGGHLASLLSTNSYYLTSVGGDSSKIKGCISISGVYSDKRLQETHVGQQLLHTAFGKRPQYYDAFPIYNVTNETPPFLLMNADVDFSMKRHTFDFHYILRQSGVFVQTSYFPNLTHFDIMKKWNRDHAHVFQTVHDFIKEVREWKKVQNAI